LKIDTHHVGVRIEDPAGWPWAVGRHWLPWRPLTHRAVAFLYVGISDGDEISFAVSLLFNIPCALLLPFVVVEWLLLLTLLVPFMLVTQVFGMRRTVVARGRRDDGIRVRYAALARPWRSTLLRDTAVTEIRTYGAPRSLGDPIEVRGRSDSAAGRLREDLRAGKEVRVECHVQGYGASNSRQGWIKGRVTALPGLLTFELPQGFRPTSWLLPGSEDVRIALAGPDDRAAIGDRVVAAYLTADGPFRIAVEPHLGPLLRDLVEAGAAPVLGPADRSWTMWRQDDVGTVREIARFGCRADAELVAVNLEARGSTQKFWVAATHH
jgi:hypothetical protein